MNITWWGERACPFPPPEYDDGKRAACNNLLAELGMGDGLCWRIALEKAAGV